MNSGCATLSLYAQTINLAGIDGALPLGLQGLAMAMHRELLPGRDLWIYNGPA